MRPGGAIWGLEILPWGALSDLSEPALPRRDTHTKAIPIPENTRRLSPSRCGTMSRPCWPQTGWSGQRERASHPSLLTGMVFDENRRAPDANLCGQAVKKGTRYRYYVSTSLITGAGRVRSSGRRIPAGNLEGLVTNRLRTFLADPGAILDAVDKDLHGDPGRSQLIERSRQIAEELGAHTPDKVKAALMTLLCRVEIKSDRVEITPLSRAA